MYGEMQIDACETQPYNTWTGDRKTLRKPRNVRTMFPTLQCFIVTFLLISVQPIESRQNKGDKNKEGKGKEDVSKSPSDQFISPFEDQIDELTQTFPPSVSVPFIKPTEAEFADSSLTIQEKFEEAIEAEASVSPSYFPSSSPSNNPSVFPTLYHSPSPSIATSESPSIPPSTNLPSYLPTISKSSIPTEHPTMVPTSTPTLVPTSSAPTMKSSSKPSLSPTKEPVITRISCPTDSANTILLRHQISYTYSIETEIMTIDLGTENIVSYLEQSLLLNLAVDVLPCDFLNNGKSRKLIRVGRHAQRDDEITLVALDSNPTDQLSTRRCSPTVDPNNSCQFIKGFLTITLDAKFDLSSVESALINKIKTILVDLPESGIIPGLVHASFYDPFSKDALKTNDSQESMANTAVATKSQLRDMLSYAAIVLLCFTLAAFAICALQYRNSASKAKSTNTIEDPDQTPPNTPPSPESLEARPNRNARFYRSAYSKLNVNKKLSNIWENMDNNREENLSTILEGSQEDVASSCASSAFGNMSILSPYQDESERDLQLIDLALSSREENDLRKENYSEDQIKDLRNFRSQLMQTAKNKNSYMSAPLSSLEEEPLQLPSPQASPRRLQDRIAFNRDMPISIHRMKKASKKEYEFT